MNQVSAIENFLNSNRGNLAIVSIKGKWLHPKLFLTKIRPENRYDRIGFVDGRLGHFYGFPTHREFNVIANNKDLVFNGLNFSWNIKIIAPTKVKFKYGCRNLESRMAYNDTDVTVWKRKRWHV